MDGNQQDLVAQFVGITGANPASAQAGLEAANWNLQEAVQLYFAAQEEPQEDGDEEEDDEPAYAPSNTTPAQAAASSSSANPPRQRKQHMTLGDLKSDDAEGDEDDDKQRDLFAGGEKSGLAVQNPDRDGAQGGGPANHFQNIIRQAQQNRERPGAADAEQPEPPRPSNFGGRAQTLGGEGTESEVVEDPTQRARDRVQRQQRERVTRTMHLWADGVSIDDGPLFRFDDPANQQMMQEINRGRAPMQLLDVQPDQEVDLTLDPHKDENYVQPKRKYKPFGGEGQRLGSPTPGPEPSSSSTATTSTPAAAAPAPASTSSTAEPAKQEVDESAPTLQLQIRLADGTRLPSRFNTTHTIGDVYAFVNRASPESNQRAYVLMQTFPSKEFSDDSQVLGDLSEFKRGGAVVQRWK